ncbi:hypothetical protein [uncultured Thiodictyon sp.]|uniref:hypothetical protein n=1 Tax=uncultured Thiodictyon sp. TaxID=1846217 RepID=UPI0025EA139A|nr:hypothetical protein [uncultured Thiodictyon sp.]
MAINERQRQKRLEAQKKKRKLVAKGSAGGLAAGRHALHYARFPIHECLVSERLFETGLGTLIWSRRMPDGMLAITAFVVDVYCLGVKDALFKVASEKAYENLIKPGLIATHKDQAWQAGEPAYARKLLQGAIRYAEQMGFAPQGDYQNAKGIFGDVDALACSTEFEYGRGGQPCYIRGPQESDARAQRIVDQLLNNCGAGGFTYQAMRDDGLAG